MPWEVTSLAAHATAHRCPLPYPSLPLTARGLPGRPPGSRRPPPSSTPRLLLSPDSHYRRWQKKQRRQRCKRFACCICPCGDGTRTTMRDFRKAFCWPKDPAAGCTRRLYSPTPPCFPGVDGSKRQYPRASAQQRGDISGLTAA